MKKAMTIRRNVEYILRRKAMKKIELSEILGITPQSLTHLLDSANIGLESLGKIARALGVKASDLIVSPHLSVNKSFHDDPSSPHYHEPTRTSLICPVCQHKLKIVAEEYEAQFKED